jgi:hypothetical protein
MHVRRREQLKPNIHSITASNRREQYHNMLYYSMSHLAKCRHVKSVNAFKFKNITLYSLVQYLL